MMRLSALVPEDPSSKGSSGFCDGDQGDDNVRAVAFKFEGDPGVAAGHDLAIGGDVKELTDGSRAGEHLIPPYGPLGADVAGTC